MSTQSDVLKQDLAQFYLVVDLVLELFTGHRHKPPRIRLEFLAHGGLRPQSSREPTWPTLIIDLKENVSKPAEFLVDLDRKVAEHVMPVRRPDRLAWYIQESDRRAGDRHARSYWMTAACTIGSFPIERAFDQTRSQYASDRGR